MRKELVEACESASEGEAFSILYALAGKFGWAGPTLYTKGDIESYIGRELTDDEWGRVQDTYAWRKFDECISDAAWELLSDALLDAEVSDEQ